VAGGSAVLRRVPPTDVRCPLRPDRKLTTLASPLDFETLNSAAANLDPIPLPPRAANAPLGLTHGVAPAAEGLRLGAAVVVRGRRPLATQGSTRSLMYHRGAEV
jgi:hypothetical protein